MMLTANAGVFKMIQDKAYFRAKLKSKLDLLSQEDKAVKSNKINTSIEEIIIRSKKKEIGIFLNTDREPSIDLILKLKALSDRRFYVPIVRGNEIIFNEISHNTKFHFNKYGIREPLDLKPDQVKNIKTFFIPLVGFDSSLQRLGHGGGFYDKLISRVRRLGNQNIEFIGVAFDIQKISTVPSEAWDEKLNSVITEKAIY